MGHGSTEDVSVSILGTLSYYTQSVEAHACKHQLTNHACKTNTPMADGD